MNTIAIIFGAISIFLFIFGTCAFISSAVKKESDETIVVVQILIMSISAIGFYLTIVL